MEPLPPAELLGKSQRQGIRQSSGGVWGKWGNLSLKILIDFTGSDSHTDPGIGIWEVLIDLIDKRFFQGDCA